MVDEKEAKNTEGKRRGRGRKPGQQPKDRPEIPSDLLNFKQVDESERVQHKRRREERTDQQQAFDQLVADAYDEWIEADMPTNWADMPITLWEGPITYEEHVEFYLRKAAGFYGRKIMFGHRTYTDPDGNIVDDREKALNVSLPFVVMARPSKKNSNKSNDDS